MRFEQIFKELGRALQADGTARYKDLEAEEDLPCLRNSSRGKGGWSRVSEQGKESSAKTEGVAGG